MHRARRIELLCLGMSAVVAGGIAVLAKPAPVLEQAIGAEGWARGVEFVLLVLVLWMLFSVAGLIRAKIGVGLDGVTAQRLVEKNEDGHETITRVSQDVRLIQQGIDRLAKALESSGLEARANHEERIQALEDMARATSGKAVHQVTVREDEGE